MHGCIRQFHQYFKYIVKINFWLLKKSGIPKNKTHWPARKKTTDMLDEISDWSQKITDLPETLCDLPTKSTDLSEVLDNINTKQHIALNGS